MNEGTLAKPQSGVAKMREVSGNTGQVGGSNQALKGGVYRHPQSGQEIIALDDPITGDAQARGYVRAGFEWVRDVKEGEITSVGLTPSEEFAKQPERKLETSADDLKGIQARLNALEAENAKLREASNASPATATELSQEEAKKAATEKTEERLNDEASGVNASTEPSNDKKESTSTKKEGK